MNPNQKYINAASGGQLDYYLGQATHRMNDFYGALASYRGKEFLYEKSELLNGVIPENLKIDTKLGSMNLRVVYGIDEKWVCAWMVFSDEEGSPAQPKERHLLAVKLGESGWLGPHGDGYIADYGGFSIEMVLREAIGAKLRLNTEFLKSLNQAPG